MAEITFGKLVIIEDQLHIGAKDIIDFTFSKNTEPANILCIEKSPEKWKKVFSHKTNFNYFTDIKTLIESIKTKLDKPHMIMIDSINHIAALTNWETTVGYINDIIKCNMVKRLIVVNHIDSLLFGNKMIKHLRYICQTCITMREKENTNKYYVDILNILPSGKIIKTFNSLHFDPIEKIWRCVEVKQESIQKKAIKKEELMQNMTSFKISVDKSAEIIKNDLILPYTETNRTDLILKPDFDDWDDDDDDPDDDLNI